MTQINILAEGGQKNGFGHIVRCLSLQQAFEDRGFEAQLIVNGNKHESGWLTNNKTVFLNWLKKPTQLLQLIQNSKILIVDSYLASASLYKKLENSAKQLICIDDNNRLLYPKNSIIINASVYGQKKTYLNNDQTLIGPKYATMRKIFWKTPAKKVKKDLKTIMITFGGGDFRSLTAPILRLIVNLYPNLNKRVIVTKAFENIKKIKKSEDKFTQLINSPSAKTMLQTMLDSDLAISSGGQTLYELARVGVPTIAIIEADNQVKNVLSWEKLGFAKNAGLWNDPNINNVIKLLLSNLEKERSREQLSTIGRFIVDGQGSLRIAKYIIKKTKL